MKWRQKNSLKFNARIYWIAEEFTEECDVFQIAYASSSVYRSSLRHEAVEYNHDGFVQRGFFHAILQGDIYGSLFTVVLIKRLRAVIPQVVNVLVCAGMKQASSS